MPRDASTGRSRGTPPTSGSRRSREPTDSPSPPHAGSSADGSTSRTTASTGTSHAGRGDKVALHFEGEPGDRISVTYADLQRRVSQAANALTALGIGPGDRVVVYLPVLIETVVIALACARIGAVHSLVFGGFSAEAVRFRLADTGAKLLVTSDGQFRRGTAVEVKSTADVAAAELPDLEHVLVVRRTGQDVAVDRPAATSGGTTSSTPHPTSHEPQAFDAEHPLFIIYTSGTTGKPKGLVHTSGGYLDAGELGALGAFRRQARRCALVHRGPRLGDRPHLRDLRSALERPHAGDLRGHARHAAPRATPRDHRALRRHRLLHRAHAHPHVHDLVRRRAARRARPLDAASARHRGGGDQPRGLGVVPPQLRSRRGARRRHLVAVRDRRGDDRAASGSDDAQAGLGDRGAAGHRRRGRRRVRRTRSQPGRSGTLVVRRPWPGMARTVWGNPQRYRDSYWARVRRPRRARRHTTSPATARPSTRTATSGSSAVSTTS